MKTMVCLENMSYSQFSHEAIQSVNSFVASSSEEICFVSFDQTMPFMNIDTAVFSTLEMDSFNDGIIIAYTIKGAELILGCTNNSKKILYLYDLDWMFQPMSYYDMYDVLSNENLILILRSEDHKQALNAICKKEPLAIMNSFNLEEVWNLL